MMIVLMMMMMTKIAVLVVRGALRLNEKDRQLIFHQEDNHLPHPRPQLLPEKLVASQCSGGKTIKRKRNNNNNNLLS